MNATLAFPPRDRWFSVTGPDVYAQSEKPAPPASGMPPKRPAITYLVAERFWVLLESFDYIDGATTIRAWNGFQFDLASIPRALWWLIGPFELSIAAPLIHDMLYRYAGNFPEGVILPQQKYTRAEADGLFKKIMREEGVSWWRVNLAYAGVRGAGWALWGKLHEQVVDK